MIVTERLSKQYGTTTALSALSLEIGKGEVYGLLGPNGSGKTTAIRLLLGMIQPSRGVAKIGGFDCWDEALRVREMVSYLPGELRLYGAMTGLGTLRFFSNLRGGHALERAVTIAERVMKIDLARKVRTYSTGMKQKLALAQAFADPVEILILDEPTSALDPSARQDVLDLVKKAKASGQTVLFSGHVLSEVEHVADRVAILRRGVLMHVEDMHSRRGLRLLLIRFGVEPEGELPEALELSVRERNGSTWLMEHRGEVGPLLGWLASQDVLDLAIGTDDLRSLYDRFHGPGAESAEEGTSA